MAGNASEIAKQFVTYYYQQFDNDRKALGVLYRDHSMLTWESKEMQGTQSIVQHMTDLPFAKVQHQVSTLDAQPSSPSQASILVLVTGQLVVDDGPHTMNYSQTFQLMPEGDSFYVFNDVFRLVYVRRPLPPKSHTESWVGKLV